MTPYLVTPTVLGLALSVADAKKHLNVEHSSDDTLIQSYIETAQEEWQRDSGRVLLTSTWEEAFDEWPCDGTFSLSRWPVASVTSIKYDPAVGTEQTVSSAVYTLYATPRSPRVMLKYAQVWPSDTRQYGPSIRVRYVAGDTAAANIDKDIITALKIRVGALYTQRENPNEQRAWAIFVKRHGLEP